MDARQRQEWINRFNEQQQLYQDAKSLSDEARAAAAAAELAKAAHDLSRSPIPLSADPTEIVKAVDKLSLENRLKAQGVENDPDVRRMLGLPPIDPVGSIKSKMGGAGKIPSPLILDLDGDGVETTAVKSGAYFDHAGDGFAEQTGWAGRDDGLLVRDSDGNGRIDSGAELFGSETLLANGSKAANGFAALAELDSNLDGVIDSSDAAFTTLRIWKDTDGDGYTDEGELLTLEEAGVQSINVGYTNSAAGVRSFNITSRFRSMLIFPHQSTHRRVVNTEMCRNYRHGELARQIRARHRLVTIKTLLEIRQRFRQSTPLCAGYFA